MRMPSPFALPDEGPPRTVSAAIEHAASRVTPYFIGDDREPYPSDESLN
jgi:hypothetical protein